MLNSYLKVFSPLETEKSRYFQKIPFFKKIGNSNFEVRGPAAYLLDWTFLFEQIDNWKKINPRIAVMVDVGCGNGLFHLFLEKFYKQGIIGIDRSDSTLDYDKFDKLGFFIYFHKK